MTLYVLQESELPREWYNVIPDLPSPPPPPLHPGTRQPVGPDDLAPLFPAALIGQEVSDRNSRASGTTSSPTSPPRPRRRCTRAPVSRSGRTISRPCSRPR